MVMNNVPDKTAADMTADEKAVFEVSEMWAKAMIGNDAEAIGSFMADDWQMVSKFGVTDKPGFLAFIASGDLMHSAMDLRELATVTVRGDTAIFIGRVTNTANYRGQTFEADEWTTDVFVRRGDTWKCVLTHITDAVERPGK